MICPKCNSDLPEDSKFCQYCGQKIEKEKIVPEENASANLSESELLANILTTTITEGQKAVDANKTSQPQNEDDTEFGFVPEKPIYTAGIAEQEKYLKKLRTAAGDPIKWERMGSISVDGVNGIIDIYDVSWKNGKKHKNIYINMYGAYNSTKTPEGFMQISDDSQASEAEESKPQEQAVPKQRKPVNKKLVVCFTAIPAAVAVLTLLLIYVLIPALKYNHAQKLLEDGNYELAYSAFENLGDYSNSEEMLLESRYLQAIKYRDNGNYDLANEIFRSLGAYRDSQMMIHEHDWILADSVSATCLADGQKTYKCSNCNEKYVEIVKGGTHHYAVIMTQEPTCREDGNITYCCSYCSDTYSEIIPLVTHQYEIESVVAATCQTAGERTYRCKTCTKTYTETIPLLSHQYVLVSNTEATCQAEGILSYSCAVCSNTYFEPIKKLSHQYVLTDSAEASCQDDGYMTYSCSLCSDTYTTTITKTSHDYVLIASVEATCSSAGSKTYQCKNCAYSYSQQVAPKTHSYTAATCVAPKTCKVCGATDGVALGHAGDGIICTRCGQPTIETVTYTGTGNQYYRNISMPAGQYDVVVTNSCSGYVNVTLYDGYSEKTAIVVYNSINDIERLTIKNSFTNGYIRIIASDYVTWKLEFIPVCD